jgi:putative phosphoribosyl transferase
MKMNSVAYKDRREAGRTLADILKTQVSGVETIVLALPRGGVPVAYEVAVALGLPLDVLSVRKLGVPGHQELAFGAIATGGVCVYNPDVMAHFTDADESLRQVARKEIAELERREHAFRGGRPPLDVRDKEVLLVDDGLATGATMRAAVQALRAMKARKVTVAVPVGPPSTCDELAEMADLVVCPIQPRDFMAVGQFYRDFDQTTDAEVHDLLRRAHLRDTE